MCRYVVRDHESRSLFFTLSTQQVSFSRLVFHAVLSQSHLRSQFSRCRDASSRLMVIVGIFDHFLPYSVQSREFHSSNDPVGDSVRGIK